MIFYRFECENPAVIDIGRWDIAYIWGKWPRFSDGVSWKAFIVLHS